MEEILLRSLKKQTFGFIIVPFRVTIPLKRSKIIRLILKYVSYNIYIQKSITNVKSLTVYFDP